MNTALATKEPQRHDAPTVRATRLAYLMFERPDLASAETFLNAFGLTTVERTDGHLLMRGSDSAPYCYRVKRGPKPRFVGIGLAVDTPDALKQLATTLHSDVISGIEASPFAGGGLRLRLRDPSGFAVEVIQGQTPSKPLPTRAPLPINVGTHITRVNAGQRPAMAPPEVLRLGHVVVEVADFQRACSWYTQHFGLIPSDVQVLPDGSPAVVFLRLDKGDTPTDHHTIAIAQGFMACYGHSAYEVVDADAVGVGQQVLRDDGYRHAWGIGRHVLGSQIFDYWYDPVGDKHEHYCDGDLMTADHPMDVTPVSREAMSQWGQAMPAAFTRPKMNISKLITLVRNLRSSPDLSVAKLKTLARIFG